MYRRLLVPMLVAAMAFAACEKRKPTATPPAPPPAAEKPVAPKPGPALGPEVRARVNGVALTGELVASRLGAAAATASAELQQAALEQVITDELQAQKAMSSGLTSELPEGPDVKAADLRRHDLAKQYRLTELFKRAAPSADEVKAWFTQHADRAQAELELQVVAFDKKANVDAFTAALAAGKSFDDAAAALYPAPPEPKPWLPAKFTFSTVPPPFWSALDALQPGMVSPFIAEQGQRGWIVRLVSRTQNKALTLEQATPAISAFLIQERLEGIRKKDEQELRAAAKVELLPTP